MNLEDLNHDIEIKRIDITRKRENANEPCNSRIDTTDDYEWIKHAIRMVKCVPSYWKSFYEWQNSTFSICQETHEYRKFSELINDPLKRPLVTATYKPPCSEMSFESKRYFRKTRGVDYVLGSGKLFIKIKFLDDSYHETKYIRKVTMDTFCSNAGGFVGMLLGYSVLQVPNIFFECMMWGFRRNE